MELSGGSDQSTAFHTAAARLLSDAD
jgi:hypothetical protein